MILLIVIPRFCRLMEIRAREDLINIFKIKVFRNSDPIVEVHDVFLTLVKMPDLFHNFSAPKDGGLVHLVPLPEF